jgi:hypothetical protein
MFPFASKIGEKIDSSIFTFSQFLLAQPDTAANNAGSLTINNKSLGDYEWVKVSGNQSLDEVSFLASDWFAGSGNQDDRNSWIIVDGDLTLTSASTPWIFTPPGRRLFTVLFVNGTLTVDSNTSISMTARGANHSATGSNIPAQDILLARGNFSGIDNPLIPATGGAGGAAVTLTGTGQAGSFSGIVVGNPGIAGTSGGTGGGAGGNLRFRGATTITLTNGGGSGGTSFSGGGGGGAIQRQNTGGSSGSAALNGGAGGNASATQFDYQAGGGAGNPGGSGGTTGGQPGENGTAGTLIIFSRSIIGLGAINSNGSNGGDSTLSAFGGGGGGGSVSIFATSSTITPSANAGLGGAGVSANTGGAGTARILQW